VCVCVCVCGGVCGAPTEIDDASWANKTLTIITSPQKTPALQYQYSFVSIHLG